MSTVQSVKTYHRLGYLTATNMEVQKAEFLTEVILSLFVVILIIQRQGNPAFGVGAIATIHSFNIARALEAYRKAKFRHKYERE